MKTILVLACALACAHGYYMTKDVKYADKDLLMKQKAFLDVFQHVHQHEVHTELWQVSKAFNVEEYYDHYTNVEAVKEFYSFYKYGMLTFDDIFSIYNEEHKKQAMALFHFFFYAKDWDTFYKSMIWARFHINEGMFVYALTVAVLHRTDMAGIVLPAPYEIYPYYFFNSEVISTAQQYKMQGFYGMQKTDEGYYSVSIPSNYTGWYMHTNPEQKVSYFTEDIGLNSYYTYFHADYPFWMGGKEFGLYKDRRGEFYLYQHQQFLARYYLERLSNDLGLIPEFSWEEPIKTGYYPDLHYYNGVYFPARDNYYYMNTEYNYYYIEMVEDYERRLRDVIDQGFFYTEDGTFVDLKKPEAIEILGNLFQGNPDSKNTRFFGYLEMYAKMLLSASPEHMHTHKAIPGVLEQFETAMRDPMFYQLYKRLISYYWLFKDHLPFYKYEEIYFPVKFEKVEVDKLVTFFDKFEADITNAVDIEVYDDKMAAGAMKKFGKIAHYQGEDFMIKASQYRLNHLPFNVKLDLTSEKATKAIIKMFIGPKYDQYGNLYELNENRENFYELDSWMVELMAGMNHIVHASTDFSWFVKDRTTYFDLYKYVMLALKGEYKFPLDMTEAHCGFPSRLMLPKGKKGGMPFQFFFVVLPYKAPATEMYTGYDQTISCGVGSGARYLDGYSFGFPLDRKINELTWFTPNMYYYDTMIYHKYEAEMNKVYHY